MTGRATPNGRRVVVVAEFINELSNSTGEYFAHIINEFLERSELIVIVVTTKTNENEAAGRELLRSYPERLRLVYASHASDSHGASIAKGLSSLRNTHALWQATRSQLKGEDLLFFGTNPTFFVLFFGLSKFPAEVKSCLLCYDYFPSNLVKVSSSIIGRSIGRLMKPLFDCAYRRINRVLVIGRCMKTELISSGVLAGRIKVVSNWADGNKIFPLEQTGIDDSSSSRPSLHTVTFQFFGNMGPLQGIDSILDAIRQVKSDNFQFVFVGRGAETNKIESFISNDPRGSFVSLTTNVDSALRNTTLNACDIAVVTLNPNATGLGVPSKTYFSLAADKPILVIANAEAETSLLTEEHGVGWVVPPQSSIKIAEKIDHICQNPSLISEIEARLVFDKYYSRTKCVRVLVDAALE